MTDTQIKDWITEYVKKNPKVAEEYKKEHLARLNAELKRDERMFNRKGYMYYHDPYYESDIIECQKSINETEKKAAEELLVDAFVEKYCNDLKEQKNEVEQIKNFTDEDRYIAGVFYDTKYYIRSQEDLKHKTTGKNKDKETNKIKKIYKTGLSKRDEFIKSGEECHQWQLELEEEFLKEYENIKGPEVIQSIIDSDISFKKYCCRSLAEISVVDAFNAMGAYPDKQFEKIDQIINMHDPNVVESAMKKLVENPTENMIALAKSKNFYLSGALFGAGLYGSILLGLGLLYFGLPMTTTE